MSILKEYILKRLDHGEYDLRVLARQARIQFPYARRISSGYLRKIRTEWRQKRSTGSGNDGAADQR